MQRYRPFEVHIEYPDILAIRNHKSEFPSSEFFDPTPSLIPELDTVSNREERVTLQKGLISQRERSSIHGVLPDF